MENFKEFFIKNFNIIISVFLLFMTINMCGISSEKRIVQKELIRTNKKIDSMVISFRNEIKIEGIKTQNRYLQSKIRTPEEIQIMIRNSYLIDSLELKK